MYISLPTTTEPEGMNLPKQGTHQYELNPSESERTEPTDPNIALSQKC
jgi:hypothetical protein